MAHGSPFLQQVREAIRVRHYSRRTEDAYRGGVVVTSCSMASATRRRWERPRWGSF
jgi:hypothetical protein